METIECTVCQGPFQVKRYRVGVAKYCSNACKGEAYSKMDRPPGSGAVKVFKDRACDGCGSMFKPNNSRHRACRTCSPLGYQGFWRYGLTKVDYDSMYAEQGGVCAVCREAEIAVIDHDHITGEVRGLLCSGCNTTLHWVERDGWIDRALAYLK